MEQNNDVYTIVQHSEINKLLPSTKEKINLLYSDIFGRGSSLDDLNDDEIVFWISKKINEKDGKEEQKEVQKEEQKEVIVSMALLNLYYPIHLFKYDDLFPSTTSSSSGVEQGKVVKYIHSVCTEKNYRNQGYCSMILKEVFTFFANFSKEEEEENEKKKLFLEVLKENISAIHLYKKLGFQLVSPAIYFSEKKLTEKSEEEKSETISSTIFENKVYHLMIK
jgi:ribosomal protein S18 acetylase RimI-like enzyme